MPSEYSSATKISLRATAGLRMLPGDQADNLLAEVLKLFAQFPFKFSDDSVSIMDGADEGAFAWVTVNYLLGNLGKPEAETVGVIDLGGGSTQVKERDRQSGRARAVNWPSMSLFLNRFIASLSALGCSPRSCSLFLTRSRPTLPRAISARPAEAAKCTTCTSTAT